MIDLIELGTLQAYAIREGRTADFTLDNEGRIGGVFYADPCSSTLRSGQMISPLVFAEIERPKQAREKLVARYKIGQRAFLDTFRGLVPCKTEKLSDGLVYTTVTKTVGAYNKGDKVALSVSHVIPCAQVFQRGMKLRINTNFKWEDA